MTDGTVEQTARGTFVPKIKPVASPDGTTTTMTLTKVFHGDLEGTGNGVMLSAGDPSAGAAGYVAMETVTGTLAGRSGSFALQHSGTMHAGGQSLVVQVVPGSGTGTLAGISGTFTIAIAPNGDHSYTLSYRLP